MTEAEQFQFDASPRPEHHQIALPQNRSEAGNYRNMHGAATDPRGSAASAIKPVRALPGPPGYEQQRITEIKQQATKSQIKMAAKGRCPKCTLRPPCKHYDSLEALTGAGDTSMLSETPGRGMFYPDTAHSHAAPSIGGVSDAKRGERSDGFSISSAIGSSHAASKPPVFQHSAA